MSDLGGPFRRMVAPTLEAVVSQMMDRLPYLSRSLDLIRNLKGVRVMDMVEETGISRSSLYKLFGHTNEQMRIIHLVKVLDYLGYRLVVVPKDLPAKPRDDTDGV